MESRAVLLYDVAAPHAEALAAWCRGEEFEVLEATNELAAISPESVNLCVMRTRSGELDPFGRVRSTRKLLRGAPIIVLGENVTVDLAIELVRLGVAEVLKLPTSPERVIARVARHLADFDRESEAGELVGHSPAIRTLREEIRSAASVPSNVLIEGETGTGKRLVAWQIHSGSPHADGPFHQVDCGLLDPGSSVDELIDLSGEAPPEPLEAAPEDAGVGTPFPATIFLDGVDELAPRLQSHLVSLLDGVGRPSWRMRPRSPRFIAATATDLLERVREGSFRADLYFRLNVVRLRIPPLRERLSDVPVLARWVVEQTSKRLGMTPPELSGDFVERLLLHSWTGNVRELGNVIERVLVGGPTRVLEADVLDGPLDPTESVLRAKPPKTSQAPGDANEIAAVLVAVGGNISRAARRLNIPRSTLRYRIRVHDLHDLIPGD